MPVRECPVKMPSEETAAEEAVWEAAALAEYAGGQWNSDTLNIRRGLLAAIDDERRPAESGMFAESKR